MNKQELIDKCIIDRNGVFPYNNQGIAYITRSFDAVYLTDYYSTAAMGSLTVDEFKQRAKELGYVAGTKYRWGFEYPNVTEDKPYFGDKKVQLEWFDRDDLCWNTTIGKLSWDGNIKSFKITDERYKPVDTSYLNEKIEEEIVEDFIKIGAVVRVIQTGKIVEIHHIHEDNGCWCSDYKYHCRTELEPVDDMPDAQEESNWYDYEKQVAVKLPAVDTICQYSLDDQHKFWYDCKIISHNKLVIDCFHLVEDDINYLQIVKPETTAFRPLDWDKLIKAKEAEQKQEEEYRKMALDLHNDMQRNITKHSDGFEYYLNAIKAGWRKTT